jgi:hypothetical protein
MPRRLTLTEALDGFAIGQDDIINTELFDTTIREAAESIGFRW